MAAVEVLRGGPFEIRARQAKMLLAGVMFTVFGLIPYPQGSVEYGFWDVWWLRVPLLVVAVPFLIRGTALWRPVSLPVLEIRRDSIRWIDEGDDESIARAAMKRAWVSGRYLLFESATSVRPPVIIVTLFDRKALQAALERQGWS